VCDDMMQHRFHIILDHFWRALCILFIKHMVTLIL
jgi:hypothetical protein